MSISKKLASLSIITGLASFSSVAKDMDEHWQASIKFSGWSHHSEDDLAVNPKTSATPSSVIFFKLGILFTF